MSSVQSTDRSCNTCGGSGFTSRGRTMHHESRHAGNSTASRSLVSHLHDLCPECLGTGVHIPREIQRTPWELAFETVIRK